MHVFFLLFFCKYNTEKCGVQKFFTIGCHFVLVFHRKIPINYIHVCGHYVTKCEKIQRVWILFQATVNPQLSIFFLQTRTYPVQHKVFVLTRVLQSQDVIGYSNSQCPIHLSTSSLHCLRGLLCWFWRPYPGFPLDASLQLFLLWEFLLDASGQIENDTTI